jgi:imidazolonepropionase-like amidohydrolase
MTKRLLLLWPLLLLSFDSLVRAEPHSGHRPLAVANVNVIDATGAPVKANITLVIEDGRITEMGDAASVRPPQGARTIDGKGKYLIPGLWDMHVHWFHERFLPLFIANGVTGVRQMFGNPVHLVWRERAAKGELLAPRQVIGSPIVDGPEPVWSNSIEVGNETDARQAVQNIKSAGYDFVKIYSRLPRDAYFAIADEAKGQGLAFAGHVPDTVSLQEASDAGQKCMEHLRVLEGCSPAGEEITRERSRITAGTNAQTELDASRLQNLRALTEKLLATYDKDLAAALFARLAKNGTWICPTLTVHRAYAFMGDAAFRDDPRMKYMPKSIRSSWQPENNPRAASRTTEDYSVAKRRYQKETQLLADMRRAGVRFIAGTDVLNPFCFPGFSLHDELALLVEAGFTPMEALQQASLNAAAYLGETESRGTVEEGKIADLVLLEANPLERITNTRRIAAVVLGGELFEKPQLDAMLASVEKLANQKSVAEILERTIEEQDVAAAVRQYHDLKTREPDAYDFGEYELNELGYRLLKAEKVKEAIEIFKLNVGTYPQSANVYDSLGEAYLADGDKERAIANYKKSVELDPRNTGAAEVLKKLDAGD